MRTFKRWSVAGAIVLVALALVACPALVPEPVGKITPMTFTVGDGAQTVTDIDDLFTNTDDRSTFEAKSDDVGVATASISGTTLTVTPVAEGKATVTITATLSNGKTATTSFMVTVKAAPTPDPDPEPDPDNNQPRLVADELPDVDDLKVGHPQTIELAPLFIDDEDDDVTFRAESRAPGTVMASATLTGTLTLTAVSVGTATIHVYADDGQHFDGQTPVPVRESFSVTVVNQAPAHTDNQVTRIGLMPDETQVIYPYRYFDDAENDPLTYEIESDMPMYAMVSEASVTGMGSFTITAVADGMAMITMTANDGTEDSEPEVLTVIVDSTDPVNNPPTRTDMTPDPVSLVLYDSPSRMLNVMGYFEDADDDTLMYDADSSASGVATADVTGAEVTITAHAKGSATITVTASDSNGGEATLDISVTVTEPSNMAPRLKSGKMLENLKIELVDTNTNEPSDDTDDSTGNDTRASDGAGDSADNRRIDLSEYFEDPDGQDSDLAYKVEVAETPEGVIDLHSMEATADAAASGEAPDGTDSDDTILVIEPLKAGTTMVTVTALDVLLKSSVPVTFEVTVTAIGSNTAPTVVSDITFPGVAGDANPYNSFIGLDGADRFKSTDTTPKKLKIDLATLFEDTEVKARSDSWTFEAVSDAPKVVTAMLEPTNNSTKPDEYYVVITRVGPGVANIDFTVTDSFGETVGTADTGDTLSSFPVRVNNRPQAQGSEATNPGTLAKLSEKYSDLSVTGAFGDVTDVTDAHEVDMVDTATPAGYFSDKDTGDTLTCRFDLRGDDIFPDTETVDYPVKDATDGDQINLAADETSDFKMKGTAYVDVWCSDGFETSPRATLTIKVTSQGSIQ